MAPKTGRNRRARGYAPESRQQAPTHGEDGVEELMADPGWCDIEPLPVSPEQYILFTPPPTFMEQMVADRASWARDIEAGVVRAIARAVAGTCLPWHADWSNWRTHTHTPAEPGWLTCVGWGVSIAGRRLFFDVICADTQCA